MVDVKSRLKYNVGQTEFINQKIIGKTIAEKHFLGERCRNGLYFSK